MTDGSWRIVQQYFQFFLINLGRFELDRLPLVKEENGAPFGVVTQVIFQALVYKSKRILHQKWIGAILRFAV